MMPLKRVLPALILVVALAACTESKPPAPPTEQQIHSSDSAVATGEMGRHPYRCSDGEPLFVDYKDNGLQIDLRRSSSAVPMTLTAPAQGLQYVGETATATGTLGPAYEGPPHHVHGGIIAAVLDQVLGHVPAALGRPGMTAYLNTTYERPTPLGPVSVRARLVAQDGWKMTVTGELVLPDGEVSARAEGLFVVPRWARQFVGTPTGDAGDFEVPAPS